MPTLTAPTRPAPTLAPRTKRVPPLATTTSLGIATPFVMFGALVGGVEPAFYEVADVPDVLHYGEWAVTPGAHCSTSTVDFGLSTAIVRPDGAAMAQQLKDESGLTVDQVGKMLGVTRRSVHNWATGAPIAPKHEARLEQLHELVFGLNAANPDERRELLLDSANGPSLYRQFSEDTDRAIRVEYPVPVNERFA